MSDIYERLRPLLDKYDLYKLLGEEDYGSLYVELEALIAIQVENQMIAYQEQLLADYKEDIANQVREAKIEAFDIAFDCHDYDRLRAYRADIAALKGDDK